MTSSGTPLEIDGYVRRLRKELDESTIIPIDINKIISYFYDPV